MDVVAGAVGDVDEAGPSQAGEMRKRRRENQREPEKAEIATSFMATPGDSGSLGGRTGYARPSANIKAGPRARAGLRPRPACYRSRSRFRDGEPRPRSENMPRHAHYVPHGVIPAVLLPFNDDLSIDEKSFRSHLRDVAATKGSPRSPSTPIRPRSPPARFDEQRRVLDDRAGRDRRPAADRQRRLGRRQPARRRASRAWRPRAAPRRCWCSRRRRSRCGQSPEMALAHFKRIADATDLPIIAFQYPLATGQGYPRETLLKMVEQVPIDPRHQGLGRQRAAARDAYPHAAEPAAAGERADDPQRLAVLLAGARLQRAALRQRQRDRRPAGGAVPRRAGQRPRRGASGSTTASIRWRGCSTPSPGPTCTTA